MHFSTQCILLSSLTYIYGLPGNVPSSDFDDPRQPRVPQGNTTTPPREPASNANGTATREDQSIGSARNGGVAPPLQSVGWAGFGGRPHATTEITSSTRGSTPGGHGRQAGGSSPNSKRSSSSGKDPAVKRTKKNADELTGNTRNQAGPSTRNINQTSSTPSASNEHEHQGKPKDKQDYVDRVIFGVYRKIHEATDFDINYGTKPRSKTFENAVPKKKPDETFKSYVRETIGDIVRDVNEKLRSHEPDPRETFVITKFLPGVRYEWPFFRKLLWSILKENCSVGDDKLNQEVALFDLE